jgi:hypothetical protein
VLVFGALLSAAVVAFIQINADIDRTVFGEWLAPVEVNIEIDKHHIHNLAILSEPNNQYYYLNPTTQNDDEHMRNVVIHTRLRSTGFHRRLYLRILEENAGQALNAIDNISIFIGNRLFYFTKDEVRRFTAKKENGYALFRIPNLHYTNSLAVKDWANYYGDFNIALKLFCGFLFYPGRFLLSYIFLFGAAFLYRKKLRTIYQKLMHKKRTGTVFFILIIVFGFCLRFNGYVRHSGWSDEIYSATITGNPTLPFLATFTDSGNPPFYNIVLRYWFKLFGWSEEAGTMLSVTLGTLAIVSLYFLVKKQCNQKTALLAAFFMAASGFAVGYSQEMRGYILKIFLSPVMALAVFAYIKKPSVKNAALYIIPGICMANTHYYGVLFIIANFAFYILYACYKKLFSWKYALLFFTGNIVIAVSFMPYFLYQTVVKHYDFYRDFTIQTEHMAILFVIALLTVFAFRYRKKMAASISMSAGIALFIYSIFMPVTVFVMAFLISFVKPLIDFRYLLPVNYPFFLVIVAILVSWRRKHPVLKAAGIFLVWTAAFSLYQGKAGIPGGGYEYYREARAYIAADAAAHPGAKSSMADNAPEIARYYGFPDMPAYSGGGSFEVVYVFNNIFHMHENEMYDTLAKHGLDDTNMLKIIPSDKIVLFKKVLLEKTPSF